MSKRDCASTNFYCERFFRHSHLHQRVKGDRILPKAKLVKKVVLSKKIGTPTTEERKSCSTGIIYNNKTLNKQKKTTKSDCILDPSMASQPKLDYCKKCGDVEIKSDPNEKLIDLQSLNRIVSSNRAKQDFNNGLLKQYYKNENFQQSSESIADIKKTSLGTIKEQSENLFSESRDSIFRIYKDPSAEELGFFNPNDADNIKNIKEFRNDNYFECHSVKSRINQEIANDKKHKCIYRFYLNERLFPVPFNTDYNENIRCMECHLPLQNKEDLSNINGMIQAKVKLNHKVQDTIVMLPVKQHLIIKERMKEQTKKELDSVYFGIIKLNLNGDSIFNRTQPDDSLALKYQKGYKKFSDDLKYEYCDSDNNGIVIV